MSLLDTIISNHGADIIGEQHDVNKINYGGEDAVKRASGSRPTGPWDAAEYGISLEAAQAKYDAAQTEEARELVHDHQERLDRDEAERVTFGTEESLDRDVALRTRERDA